VLTTHLVSQILFSSAATGPHNVEGQTSTTKRFRKIHLQEHNSQVSSVQLEY